MELHQQIKKYRTQMNWSQEELAQKVYVSRQTISNWENNKSYPDVHSLLSLSSLFNISLDQLIKGDLAKMKEEITHKEVNQKDLKTFNRDGGIFTLLLILFILSFVPLITYLSYYGIAISAVLFAVTMYYALRLEKYKNTHDIQTYKEIISFIEGTPLNEIEKAQEYGKRPYQSIFYALSCGLITLFICLFLHWLLK